jgi:hypothetical protein
MTNYRNVHEMVSDLVACALIEGAQPSLNASLETKRVKQLLLDEIEQRSRELRLLKRDTHEPGASRPINRALIHARSYESIRLLNGTLHVDNRSPDTVLLTVDRATVKSAEEPGYHCGKLKAECDDEYCPTHGRDIR